MLAMATQAVAVPTDLQGAAQLQQVELLLPNHIQELQSAVNSMTLSETLSDTDKLALVQLSVAELGAAQTSSMVDTAALVLSGAVMTVCGAVVDLDEALSCRAQQDGLAALEVERLSLQPLLENLRHVCRQLNIQLKQCQVLQEQPQHLQHSEQHTANGLQQEQQQEQQEQLNSLLEQCQVPQQQPQHLQHSGQHTVSGLQQEQQEKLCDELLQKIQVMVEQLAAHSRWPAAGAAGAAE